MGIRTHPKHADDQRDWRRHRDHQARRRRDLPQARAGRHRPLHRYTHERFKFDSSKDRGQPFQFTIGMGQVIKAWDEGMMKMSVAQTAKLTCTPDYAYGERGFPPVIPPASTLIFEVELLGVK